MSHGFLVKLEKEAKIDANSVGSTLQQLKIKILVLSDGSRENVFLIINKHHLSASKLNTFKLQSFMVF